MTVKAVTKTNDEQDPALVLVRVFEPTPESEAQQETRIPMWSFLNAKTNTVYVKGTISPVLRRIEDLLSKQQIARSDFVEFFYSTAHDSEDKIVPQAVRLQIPDVLCYLRSVEEGLGLARTLYAKSSNKRTH